jgi:hypothetical protein
MKYSSGVESASVSYLGTDEHIDEFVLFANSKDAGFAVMTGFRYYESNSVVTLMSVLKSSILIWHN